MVDYRKFLAKSERLVLPYLGGLKVHAPDRPLTLVGDRPAQGWWSFEVKGRNATVVEAAEAPTLADRPRIRGHYVAGWLFTSGATVEAPLLVPEDDPPALSPVTARRWYDGTPIFDGLEFDDEPELGARTAIEENQTIASLKGVTPSLRVAFGYARLRAAARVEVSPYEAMAVLPGVADGTVEPEAWVAELHARRFHVPGEGAWHRPTLRPPEQGTRGNAETRASEVLAHAGATLLSSRFMSEQQLEVAFRFPRPALCLCCGLANAPCVRLGHMPRRRGRDARARRAPRRDRRGDPYR